MTEPAPDLAAENARLRLRLERERRTRLEAETLAEHGTRQLYRRQQQLEMLQVIAKTANAAETVEECLQVALDEWCRYTSWPVGHVYLLADDTPGGLLSAKLWHLDSPEAFTQFRAITENTPLTKGVGLPGAVLAGGDAVWVVDVTQAKNFPRAENRSNLNVRGAFAFPIRMGQETVAIAEFFSTQTEEINEAWLSLATQIGTLLGRVFERLKARREIDQVHRELVNASRQAGMAEIATGVLHNVGNVLNSVNLSASMILDQLRNSKATHLAKAVQLLQAHKDDLGHFLTEDPRGKQLPAFFEAISNELTRERAMLTQEAGSLNQNVEHIKNIVAMQQSHAKVSGALEKLAVPELVEEALRMSSAALGRHRIEVTREFAEVPTVLADRHKVLQILVNLVNNAKHALDSRTEDRRLTLRVIRGEGRVRVEVADNGVGIPPENLTRIFQHGFTTKRTGHGFGLHSGANTAKEMGGSLNVHSDGLGRGATFSLEIPLQPRTDGPVRSNASRTR